MNKANDEMRALDKIDTKRAAIFNIQKYGHKFRNARLKRNLDTTGTIQLQEYKLNYLKYSAETKKEGLAVFSEIYYADGWNAYVDGKKQDHFRANFVLRGLVIPAGNHEITFKFEPKEYVQGNVISLISSLLLFMALGALITMAYKRIKGESSKPAE